MGVRRIADHGTLPDFIAMMTLDPPPNPLPGRERGQSHELLIVPRLGDREQFVAHLAGVGVAAALKQTQPEA